MARSLNGSTDKIDCTGAAILAPSGNFSRSAWIFISGNPAAGAYFGTFGCAAAGVGSGYVGRNVGNTATHHAYYIGAAPSIHVDPGSASLSLSTWYHTAATWDGATLTTYVNGALDGTASGSGSLGGNAGHSTAIGWDEATPGRNFNGSIGECCIWSVALSASEVLALAKGARPFNVRPLSILGGWSLDGLASPEPDFSGNKNNGTLTGTALAFGPPLMQFTPRWPQFAPFDVFVFNLMPQIIW